MIPRALPDSQTRLSPGALGPLRRSLDEFSQRPAEEERDSERARMKIASNADLGCISLVSVAGI